ncbi:MAG: amino acid adenylation domain-containing protein, partial [bacterium]|nr:amino acid adenylation domain-containing protein [bacterium]
MSLTSMQEGMLLHYLKEPAGENYIEQLSLNLSGKIDAEIFENTWNFVVRKNEMLRTLFRWEKVEKPIQVTLKEHQVKPVYYDFSGESIPAKKKRLETAKIHDRGKKFDLQEVPFRVTLCKMAEDKYEMIICNHHILYDGWSNGIILNEFFETYYRLRLSDTDTHPFPPKTKFKEFIKYLQNREISGEETYWRNYLKGVRTREELSIKRVNGKSEKDAATYHDRCGSSTTAELQDFVQKRKITFASLLYSAWGILLQKYNDSDDALFGTTVSGRDAKVRGIEHIVGLFINTLPLRIQGHPDETAGEFLTRVNEDQQMRKEYDSVPLIRIKEYSEMDVKEDLFDTILVIENYPLDKQFVSGNGRLGVNSYRMMEYPPYDLTVGITISDDIELTFYYKKQRFHEDSIQRLSVHFRSILHEIVKNPGEALPDIEVMPAGEKSKVLHILNATDAGYPAGKTIHQLFENQVDATPDNIAVVSMESERDPRFGDTLTVDILSYNELNKRANRLAWFLMRLGVRPDTLVGIMAERSAALITGILGILKSGGAYLPIDPTYPKDRAAYMLADSNIRLLLVTKKTAGIVSADTVVCLEDDEICSESAANPGNINRAADLAYVIYTSGTTGKPKGTLIEHRNVVRLMVNNKFQFDFNKNDVWTMFHSACFDFSVWEMYGALLYGGKLVVVPKLAAMETDVYLSLLKQQGVTVLNQTPTAFYNLANEETKCEDKQLHVRYVIFGGEALKPAKVNEWQVKYPEARLINMFGITETTVHVTFKEITGRDIRYNISNIGTPIPTLYCYIMDRNLKLMPLDVPGELYVGGDGVARGYLNKPELTAQRFIDNPYQENRTLYKSGDLVKLRNDEELEYVGRADHQVKIRGFRVELGEIENQLHEHPKIKEVVVLLEEEEDGDKYLCAYLTTDPGVSLEVSELRECLAGELPNHMIPSYFVQLDKIPMTRNGKVDRKALPEHGARIERPEHRTPRNETEKKIAAIWSDVLGIDKERIGIDEDFFELGAHSLKAAAVVARLQKALNIKIHLAEMFERPTIKELGAYIDGLTEVKYTSVEPAEAKEHYPLSSAQKRVYLHQQLQTQGTGYNIPSVWTIEGHVIPVKLEDIFKKLIRRHESLRTAFMLIDGEPVQRIYPDVEFKIGFYDTAENFVRPFDLSRAPLLRVGLVKETDTRYTFMLDMHHIITDGVSMRILIEEFTALYSGNEPPRLKLHYKDFSQWQRKRELAGEMKKQEEYWLSRFKDPVPGLDLPMDFERPAIVSFHGDTIDFTLGKEESRSLKKLAAGENASLFMVLLAFLYVLSAKISKQEDIVIGTSTAGRRYPELDHIVGMFVNTLALRNRPGGEKTFTEFLREVRDRTLEAFENQDYPFDHLVDRVVVDKDIARAPLFDIFFEFFDEKIAQVLEMHRLKLIPRSDENEAVKFDLNIIAVERAENLDLKFKYNTKLFKMETVHGFIDHFKMLVSIVTGDPGRELSAIKIISQKEREKVLDEFNDDL